MISTPVRKHLNRVLLWLLGAAIGIAAIFLIVLSPAMLIYVDRYTTDDWRQLADIGQAYGGISALLSAFALIGVIISIINQSREIHTARRNDDRAAHRGLILYSIDHPEFLQCWEPVSTDDGSAFEKAIFFCNLILNMWYTTYIGDDKTTAELRLSLHGFFRGEIGRAYWSQSRQAWNRYAQGRVGARFVRIVNEQYELALQDGVPVLWQPPNQVNTITSQLNAPQQNEKRNRWLPALLIAAATAASVPVVSRTLKRGAPHGDPRQ